MTLTRPTPRSTTPAPFPSPSFTPSPSPSPLPDDGKEMKIHPDDVFDPEEKALDGTFVYPFIQTAQFFGCSACTFGVGMCTCPSFYSLLPSLIPNSILTPPPLTRSYATIF